MARMSRGEKNQVCVNYNELSVCDLFTLELPQTHFTSADTLADEGLLHSQVNKRVSLLNTSYRDRYKYIAFFCFLLKLSFLLYLPKNIHP